MQACVYEEYGPAEVVKVREVTRPRMKDDDVLVRVHAASVTTADWRFRASAFPGGFWLVGRLMVGLLRPRNPILGMDFSGVVEETGKRVTRFRVGDRVFGSASGGAHAEYLAVPGSAPMIHKPDGLTHEQAAAIPFGANTALAFLRDIAKIRASQRVLVVGASGGVGVWAVQLARHLGAEVTGACSTRNVELVASLGAHHVVDYTAGPLAEPGADYDLIFDTVGVTTFAGCKPALADAGTYLPLNASVRQLVQALFTSSGKGKKLKAGISSNSSESLETAVGLIEAGALRPVIDKVYPMTEIVEAHRRVDSRHKRGSVIVALG
ncbi:MAG: NAD(P)-dependent alcohol dehydrogenase [Polyangiaceae bacterium]|nr:NAD(P)-dependent alcohol dehydrogenase [Polyangiaceae bacterium]